MGCGYSTAPHYGCSDSKADLRGPQHPSPSPSPTSHPKRAAPAHFKRAASRAGFDLAADGRLPRGSEGQQRRRRGDLPAWGDGQRSHSRQARRRPLRTAFRLASGRVNSPGKEKLGLHVEKAFPDYYFFLTAKALQGPFHERWSRTRAEGSSTSLFPAKPSPEHPLGISSGLRRTNPLISLFGSPRAFHWHRAPAPTLCHSGSFPRLQGSERCSQGKEGPFPRSRAAPDCSEVPR